MRTQHPSIVLVGENIRRLRESAGYSQDEFAAHIELDRSYYGHVERGNYNITLEVLFRIAVGLEVDPGELLPRVGRIGSLPPPSGTRGRRR